MGARGGAAPRGPNPSARTRARGESGEGPVGGGCLVNVAVPVGPGANFLATRFRLYADAGQVVTAAITRFNLAASASEAVTLVGYLVPTP